MTAGVESGPPPLRDPPPARERAKVAPRRPGYLIGHARSSYRSSIGRSTAAHHAPPPEVNLPGSHAVLAIGRNDIARYDSVMPMRRGVMGRSRRRHRVLAVIYDRVAL